MSVKSSSSGPQAVTLIGLVVGAFGIAILSPVYPPGHHHPAGRHGLRRARPMAPGTGCGGVPRPVRHDRLPDQSHGLEQPDLRGQSERGDGPGDPGDRCAHRGARVSSPGEPTIGRCPRPPATPRGDSFSSKSGVVDAIGFGLTGTIARLSGTGTGALSVQVAGRLHES